MHIYIHICKDLHNRRKVFPVQTVDASGSLCIWVHTHTPPYTYMQVYTQMHGYPVNWYGRSAGPTRSARGDPEQTSDAAGRSGGSWYKRAHAQDSHGRQHQGKGPQSHRHGKGGHFGTRRNSVPKTVMSESPQKAGCKCIFWIFLESCIIAGGVVPP